MLEMANKQEKVQTILADVENNSQYALDIIESVIQHYTENLDDLMNQIKKNILEDAAAPDTDLLEKYFLALSNTIYFVSSEVEKLGVYNAISKISYKESYNNFYMNPKLEKAKPTVAELTAYAEGEAIYDQTVNEIYARAYKTLQLKINAAETMVSTISKILSRRISEQKLSSIQPLGLSSGLSTSLTGRQVLTEENIY